MIFDQLIAIAKSQNINNEPNISNNMFDLFLKLS